MTSATAKKAALSLANVVPGTPVYPGHPGRSVPPPRSCRTVWRLGLRSLAACILQYTAPTRNAEPKAPEIMPRTLSQQPPPVRHTILNTSLIHSSISIPEATHALGNIVREIPSKPRAPVPLLHAEPMPKPVAARAHIPRRHA